MGAFSLTQKEQNSLACVFLSQTRLHIAPLRTSPKVGIRHNRPLNFHLSFHWCNLKAPLLLCFSVFYKTPYASSCLVGALVVEL